MPVRYNIRQNGNFRQNFAKRKRRADGVGVSRCAKDAGDYCRYYIGRYVPQCRQLILVLTQEGQSLINSGLSPWEVAVQPRATVMLRAKVFFNNHVRAFLIDKEGSDMVVKGGVPYSSMLLPPQALLFLCHDEVLACSIALPFPLHYFDCSSTYSSTLPQAHPKG